MKKNSQRNITMTQIQTKRPNRIAIHVDQQFVFSVKEGTLTPAFETSGNFERKNG